MEILIYTKPGCHLCEQAYDDLKVSLNEVPVRCDIQERNILEKENWYQEYKLEIPVIVFNQGTVLKGKFGRDAIEDALKRCLESHEEEAP